MTPEIALPVAVLTGIDADDYLRGCLPGSACLVRVDPDFARWVEAISEGHCPACRGPLAAVCALETREEWLVCPNGRWLRLAWGEF